MEFMENLSKCFLSSWKTALSFDDNNNDDDDVCLQFSLEIDILLLPIDHFLKIVQLVCDFPGKMVQLSNGNSRILHKLLMSSQPNDMIFPRKGNIIIMFQITQLLDNSHFN